MRYETHEFKVGAFTCTLLSDGTFHYPAEGMVPGISQKDLAKWLDKSQPDVVPSPWICLLVDTGDRKLLIDTGGGPTAVDAFPGTGKLFRALQSRGVTAEQIDTVVISHGHPDHAGGCIDALGEPAFPNARYVMLQDDWQFWTSEETLQALEGMGDHFYQLLASFPRRCLPPIERQLELLAGEHEIVPGIHAIPAPGHTPGHMVVRIESHGDSLLYLADTAVHPLYLEQPSWHLVADTDPDAAVGTRRRVLDMAATENMAVVAFHFPFPGLGRIERNGDAWRWQPLA